MVTDAERQRVLEEARSLIAKRPERYVPPPEPVRFRTFYDPPDEADEPEPAPEPLPAPRSQQQDWSGWETWVAARVGDAIAVERKAMCEIMAHALADYVAKERKAIEKQMQVLRSEFGNVQKAFEQLREVIAAERSQAVDLPNPLHGRDLN